MKSLLHLFHRVEAYSSGVANYYSSTLNITINWFNPINIRICNAESQLPSFAASVLSPLTFLLSPLTFDPDLHHPSSIVHRPSSFYFYPFAFHISPAKYLIFKMRPLSFHSYFHLLHVLHERPGILEVVV